MRLTHAFVIAAILFAGSGWAQGRDVTAADALFREARALMKTGDFEGACPKLVESHKLDPAPGTAINLGDCWEKVGRLADALQALRDALDLLPAGDNRAPLVKKQIAALEPRVPRLTIALGSSAPEGTQVKRDGIELGSGSLGAPLPVNPGEHTIEVTAPDRESRSFAVTLRVGEARQVEVIPGLASDRAGGSGDADDEVAGRRQSPEVARADESNAQRTIGFVSLVAGGVALGFAAYFQLDGNDKHDSALRYCGGRECAVGDPERGAQQALSDDADSSYTKATVLGVLGGIGLVGGIVLVLTAPESPAGAVAQRARVGGGLRVVPAVTTHRIGAQVGGVF